MSLDFILGEDDVTAKIKTVPGIDVMEGEYVFDSYVPDRDANGMWVPYVTIKFNGAFPAHDNGIVGPELDTQRISFSVYVCAPTSRVSRAIRDQITKALLTDFAPTDGSSLLPAGSLSFIDVSLGWKRYISNISYSYMANLSN
jgi:hypothetical protein